MGLIPSLTSISGTISAAPHNANYSAIRTAVNTYCAFVDQTATITGAWTFSTSPTITNALTIGTGLTVTSGGATITAGGVTITAGGLTVSAGGANITGTCTATTFSGSGASLTSLPAANLTGTLPAISGVNLTNLNASNLASGTVSSSRLPTSYSALTITTLTSTAVTGLQSIRGNAGSTDIRVYLDPAAAGVTRFVEFGNGTACITASAPTASTTRYLIVTENGTEYRIKMESAA